MSTGHRPGPFKAPPKKHKTGGHRTKGQMNDDNRGRVQVRDIVRSNNRSLSRDARKCQTMQRRKIKNTAALERKRALGGAGAPPTLATVLCLGDSVVSPNEFVAKLGECDDGIIQTSSPIAQYFSIPRFKSRLGFLTPGTKYLEDTLDALKASDVLCIVWPLSGELSSDEDLLLSAVLSHGIPSVLHIAPGLSTITSSKQRDLARSNVKKLIDKWSLCSDKIMCADTVSDGLNIIRAIVDMKKKKLIIQKRRSHILVEKLSITNEDKTAGTCTLLASGYVRGPAWNVNRLVHLPGLGDFQVSQIVKHDDPHPVKGLQGEWNEAGNVIATADPSTQESIQSEIIPDPMEGEQALLDEDLKLDEDKLEKKPEKRKVPKGTSSYQAAWILDPDEENDDEECEGEDDDDDEEMDDDSEEDDFVDAPEDQDEEEQEEIMIDDGATEAGDPDFVDEEIDMTEVEKYRQERENAQWPDEIDTPLDEAARVRYQKYRGMKSFRTSPWDKHENLPLNYARIFKFHNFKKTKKNVLKDVDSEKEGETAPHGSYITLYVSAVPLSYTSSLREDAPIVFFGMLPHEQKMSLVNMVIRRHPSCTVPIPSKSNLIFHVGFRKFEAQPVFSQHTNGDKFKMERFLRDDGPVVASVFAPITFPPCSVLVFRRDLKGKDHLVASGSVHDNNPDRIILKRIVLSGHPFKINKRSVVVRYLFFNREDIEWFKPVELYTPRGRRGHIKEAVGTHGYMKCKFDQQLNAQDSVMMSLYKRVFPKWTYQSNLPHNMPQIMEKMVQDGEAMDV